jgi:hypothetical protein
MGRAAACGAALRNFELTKSGASDFATLKPFPLLTALAVLHERPGAGGCASGTIGAGASCPTPLGRLDLKASVEQSLDDDLGRPFGVKNLGREVGAAEKVGQHVLRGELAYVGRLSPCQAA